MLKKGSIILSIWRVNVLLSVLYIVGIGLAGYSIFKRQAYRFSKGEIE